MKASDIDGAGITDANTLKLAFNAANRLTHEILEGLSANDIRAASTNVIIAHPMGIIQRRRPSIHRQSRARGHRAASDIARAGRRAR